jgi:hypothetical protein
LEEVRMDKGPGPGWLTARLKAGELGVKEAFLYRRLVMQGVYDGLAELGESVAKAVLYYLKQGFEADDYWLAEHPEELTRRLEQIFGAGGRVIEQLIVRRLYQNLGLSPVEDASFIEAVKAARTRVRAYLEMTGFEEVRLERGST